MSWSAAYRHTSRAVQPASGATRWIERAARQPERLDFADGWRARRLIAAQRREPGVVAFERREERSHLVARAAGFGALGLPQPDARLCGLAG